MYTLTAGAIAGAIEATITYPTEFVKTQLQLQSGTKGSIPKGATDVKAVKGPIDILVSTVRAQGVTAVYKGLSAMVIGNTAKAGVRFFAFDQFRYLLRDSEGKTTGIRSVMGTKCIIRAEGLGGVYRGLVPVMARQGANGAVRFGVYSALNDLVKSHIQPPAGTPLPATYTFGIGAIAGIVTVYTTMPLDVVKTKMQGLHARQLYSGVMDCCWKVFKSEGILSFWSGATPRLARLSMSGGIVFSIYESTMGVLRELDDNHSPIRS
ncbi:hypothetical protein BGW38_009381 [Lunasporangiospora selenospora]|uniref:Uncharacterized protein n=1 Tax=Lunasporangiospora selenospora TaxID=979761 RepID=A0A9P6FXZ8_9FUNG|nr:hypothetical protein BGW38_009381 [Lunasporangiospora selenospora]